MATDLPISGLPHNPEISTSDKLEILDVSDTTNHATGENTYATVAELAAIVGGGSSSPFVAAGPSHATGLVPDPGATAHGTPYILGDDGTFHPISGTALSYSGGGYFVTAGTGGGGAPTDATYITQSANGSLSAEQSLGALATGLLLNTVTAGTGVLSTATGADLPNHDAAKITTGKLAVARMPTLGGLPGYSGGLIYIGRAGTPVVNNAARTPMTTGITDILGSRTFGANSMVAGQSFTINMGGYFSCTVSQPTLLIEVVFLGVTILRGQATLSAVAQTTALWMAHKCHFSVPVIGASGRVLGACSMVLASSVTDSAASSAIYLHHPGVNVMPTVDTTAAGTIDVFCTWGTADPSNSITLNNFEIIGNN